MEELQPQDIEELLQELEEEGGVEESLPPEVEELLQDLQPTRRPTFRRRAAKQLGEVSRSNRQIVQALVTAAETDSATIRAAAAESLRAPVHQEFLQQHPDLMEATERALQQRPGSKPITRPAHFRVVTQGDTLCISWKPHLSQRLNAAETPLLLLMISLLLLLMGGVAFGNGLLHVWVFVLCVAAFGSGYWILAMMANATRITAGKEEWTFHRSPLPFPKRRFYLRPRRLDPAACRWVWTDRVEEHKWRWSSGSGGWSGGSVEGPLGCLLGLVGLVVFLSSIERELVVTYKLYARCVDGGDNELLRLLSEGEAGYLEQRLQHLLKVGGRPQAEE